MTIDMRTAESPTTDRPRHPARRRRIFIIAAAVIAIITLVAVAGIVWLTSTASVRATGIDDCPEVPTTSKLSAADESAARNAVCATIEALTTAWSAHDAEAYGAAFTAEATYTTFAGTHYDGRQDIVDSHAALWNGPLDGTQLADRFLSLRLLTPDVAVLSTRGDTYEGERPDELAKVQTYTLIREGDEWQIAAFHNTKRNRLMEQIQFLWMPETKPAAERP